MILLFLLTLWDLFVQSQRPKKQPLEIRMIGIVSQHRICVVPIELKKGWRLYMEDAHLSIAPFTDKKLGLFAVFDGHGGKCFCLVRG